MSCHPGEAGLPDSVEARLGGLQVKAGNRQDAGVESVRSILGARRARPNFRKAKIQV